MLILMSEMGFGHRSAANAVAEAVRERYGDDAVIEVVNPMSADEAPPFLRSSQGQYDEFVRALPELYKVTYEVSDTAVTATAIEGGLTLLLLDTLNKLIDRFKPDVIVTTYQNYLAPLQAVFLLRKRIPLVTVITDLTTIHRMWYHHVSDICVVPTREARDLALKYGLSEHKLRLIGIPVNPEIARETRPKAVVAAELGWAPDRRTLLVAGSKRSGELDDTMRALNHSGLPIQLAIVAGGDDALYDKLKATEWHVPAHIYNFVNNMPTLMHAADCIICKAGGLIVSESMAAGLPLLVVDLIEGQETGNLDYVVETGAGVYVPTPVDTLETVYHWLADDARLLHTYAAHARAAGRPRAAYDIAQIAWQLAHEKRTDS
jgi:1,2-diacylglycerol 3-beta-galactosyltransferase